MNRIEASIYADIANKVLATPPVKKHEEPKPDPDRSLRLRLGFDPDEPIPTFEDFDVTRQRDPAAQQEVAKAFSLAQQVVAKDLTFLTLSGPYGTGKSHLLKAAILEGRGYYLTAYDFDKRIKQFRKDSEDYSREFYVDPDDWLERVAKVPLLAIDDIGAGYIDKGWTQSRFERLIDMRYRAERRTLFSTNMDTAEFRRELGERVWDRLFDSFLSEVVFMRAATSMRDTR